MHIVEIVLKMTFLQIFQDKHEMEECDLYILSIIHVLTEMSSDYLQIIEINKAINLHFQTF